MSLTRRGFLGILGTAFSTSMVLGPSKLWVPEPKAITAPELVVENFTMSEIDQIVNAQGALAELAMRCAVKLGERLERHRGTVLRKVLYEKTGQVDVASGQLLLTLDDDNYSRVLNEQDNGYFQPYETRTMATCPVEGRKEWGGRLNAESALISDLSEKFGHFEMFAPLGVDLRPGVPFDKKMLVGIGQDPSTGLTVRALKFEHTRGRDHGDQMIAIEVGGGVLYNRERGTRRSMSARKLIV